MILSEMEIPVDPVPVLLVLGVFTLAYLYLKSKYNHWSSRGIPTARNCVFGLGHTLDYLLMRGNFGTIASRIYHENPGVSMVGLYNKFTPVLLIREPALAKQVLVTNFASFHKNLLQLNPETDKLLSHNPFFSSGDTWRKSRTDFTSAFSTRKLKILFNTVSQVCRKLGEYLDARLKQGSPLELELKDLFSRFTGEVVANGGFGIVGDCFEERGGPWSMYEIGKRVFEPNLRFGLNQILLFFMPFLGYVFHASFLPKRVEDHFRRVIHDVLKERQGKKFDDFFQVMLDYELEKRQKIDEHSVAVHAASFFLDGHETSSTTLMYAGFQLARNQQVQEKLRQEVLEVLARHGNELTYDSLKEMTYMDDVLNESMRLFPVLTTLSKVCTSQTVLEGPDGLVCTVEPGTTVLLPMEAIQRDERYFQDPQEFKPERFQSGASKEARQNFTFLPFGEGPRICVGMRMGVMQSKAALATVLSRYRMELAPRTKDPVEINPLHFINYPKGGIWVKVRRVES